MAQKINIVLMAAVVLLIGCARKSDALYYYQFQDRTDCECCFPAYCFYYDTAFHYTAIRYGFYENDNGFLRDSLFFTSMRDSIVAMKVPAVYNNDGHFDSIKCYCEYPSHWRFSFEMSVYKQGKCQLILHTPYYKEGMYFFDLSSSERRLIDYSVCQLSTKDTGVFMNFGKMPHVPGDPVYFLIKVYRSSEIYSYIGNQDADDVPASLFFFRDALGAIAQNHFSKQNPNSEIMANQSVSDELFETLHRRDID